MTPTGRAIPGLLVRIALFSFSLLAVLVILAPSAHASELRGWWVDAWGPGFRSQAEVETLLGKVGDPNSRGRIRDANCNAVFVQVRRRADVCYPSAMGEPYFSGLSPSNFNALQAIINAAHDTTGGKQRVEVHAWIVTFSTSSGASIAPLYYQKSNQSDPANYWITQDQNGTEPDDKPLDPGHPGVLAYITDVCMDLVENYDIDGIHFDYIRFTGENQGYNPTSVARYNERYGLTGNPSTTDEQFKQWRRDQVTNLVRQVYARTIAAKPQVKVSAAVVTWAPGPTASTRSAFTATRPYTKVYSDWDAWMQEGIMDLIVPMAYFNQNTYPNEYQRWMNFTKDRKAARHAAIGPGVYLNSISNAILQLQKTREVTPSGASGEGFVGYSYRVPYSGGTWPEFSPSLVAQVTPAPAEIPQMPWKTSPTRGHLMGVVTSLTSGLAVDGAMVSVTGPTNRTQRTDGTGFYAFIDLPAGNYTLQVSHPGFPSHGSSAAIVVGQMTERNIQLGAIDPPAISNVQISNITYDSATITWTTNSLSDTQVEFGPTAQYGSFSPLDSAPVLNHSVTLSGLNPGTTYNFRALSANGAGSAVSNNFAFTTAPFTGEIIVDNLDPGFSIIAGPWTVASLASTSKYGPDYIYVTGVTNTNEAGATRRARWTPNVPVSGLYDVFIWYASGANRTNNAFWKINHLGGFTDLRVNQKVGGNGWSLLSANVPFQQGTSGYIDLANNSGDTSIVQGDAVRLVFKSLIDQEAPSIPGGLSALSNTPTSIQLNWSPSTDNMGVAGYRVFRNQEQVGASSDTTFTDNAGLLPNTAYDYRVSALDTANNESAPSNLVTRVTLAMHPADVVVPGRSTGTWFSSNGFPFSNPLGWGAGTVAKFRLAWNQNPEYVWGSGSETDWPFSNIIRGASSAGSWYLHLRSFNSENEAGASHTFGPFNYDPSAPVVDFVNDEGTTLSTDTLNATWQATDPHSGVVKYEYSVGTSPGAVNVLGWTDSDGESAVHITGLSLAVGQKYYINVRAENAAGLVSAVASSAGVTVVQATGSIPEARALADGAQVAIAAKPISAAFDGFFYILEPSRAAGIRVVSPQSVTVGQTAQVAGVMATVDGLERAVQASSVSVTGAFAGDLSLFFTHRQLGGQAANGFTPGVTGAVGLNNVGLLARSFGTVTAVLADGFVFNDGSNLVSGYPGAGVLVWTGSAPTVAVGDWVKVTGIISLVKSGQDNHPRLLAVSVEKLL